MSEPNQPISHIGVIGAGTMGSGIALAALFAGLDVTLYDIAPDILERARQYIQKFLARKGKEPALVQLILTDQLDNLAGVSVVIEAALEDLALKQELFGKLDAICPPPAVLATNTSTLPVTAIAAATSSPERVGGMHFFNPAPVMPLVEVARAAQTSEATVQTIVALALQLDKTPVVTRDMPGFIVNRVARPFYLEALRLVGDGVATPEQVDQVVQLGGHFRMGPFQLMDLIGIDINFTAAKSLYEQTFGEPRFRPHQLQIQKVQQNALGRKTGQGFYQYGPNVPPIERPVPPPIGQYQGTVRLLEDGLAPGLGQLCRRAGYTVNREAGIDPIAGFIATERRQMMVEGPEFDEMLPAQRPLFCQAADVTVTEIATWLKHPERLVGFDSLFIGAGQAATLVASPRLADAIRDAAEKFFAGLGRHVVWIEDSPGLILPRIVCTLINEAAFAVTEGVAEGNTIDQAMKLGVNYPKGPIAWASELGFGRVVAVLDHLYSESGESRYRPAPLLRRWARLEQLQRPGK